MALRKILTLKTLIYRIGQFIHRHRVASVAAALLLLTLLSGVIASIRQAHRAKLAKADSEHSANNLRQPTNARLPDSYDPLNDPSPTRIREGGMNGLTDNRYDVASYNGAATTAEDYHPASFENFSTALPTDQESAVDNRRARTYRRDFPTSYPYPGGVSFLTGVDLAALNLNDGDFLTRINRPQAAIVAFQQKIALDEQLASADPGNVQVQADLAYNSSRVGDLLAEMGDNSDAVSYYQRAVDIYTRSAATGSQEVMVPLQLSELLGKLAKTHARLGHIEKALAESNKAADLLETLPDDTADVAQRLLRASAYSEVGDAYFLLAGDTRTPENSMKKLWGLARTMYEHSLKILEELRDQVVLNADQLAKIDTLSHEIAECDQFLAK